MAFLDNSGDIILDAVLTDTGRARMAKGDGTFKIVKFALGDDEINYGRYDLDHASGSAYFDLEILQTPVLEAFTNNTSLMRSKLISIPRTNLLYLPILELNEQTADRVRNANSNQALNNFVVAVDANTERPEAPNGIVPQNNTNGIMLGVNTGGSYIRVDQGLDTDEIPPGFALDADLVETQYIVEIDNRFGKLVSTGVEGFQGNAIDARVSFIDDDNIASYYFSLGTDPAFVINNANNSPFDNGGANETIEGPRGTILAFRVKASLELNSSTFLFNQVGRTSQTWTRSDGAGDVTNGVDYIDSLVRVTGATTGYRIDIPVRFVKVR